MKKTNRIVALIIAVVMCLAVVVALAACQPNCDKDGHKWGDDGKCTVCGASKPADPDNPDNPNNPNTPAGPYLDFEDYLAYIKADLGIVYNSIGEINATIDAKVDAAFQAGLTEIGKATTITAARKAYNDAKAAMADCIPLASGVKSFTAASVDAKTEIMGKLEGYAVRNGITGITLFENGGYQIFNERVTTGAEHYILGYGFGTLAEGSLTKPLATEPNAAWKMYYHAIQQDDPGTINALNEDGSIVSDLYALIAGTYYNTFMNSSKDGYIWSPVLADADPIPVGGLDANGQARKWRFKIREGLKYDTLGAHKDKYAGLDVQPEDFLTPYKLLFNQANNLFRGKEAVGQSGAQYIVGSKEYYEATAEANKGVAEGVDFSGVGVKVVQEDDAWYFEYELDAALTPYYARYYISSTLYSPVPASFITDIGGIENFLGFDENEDSTPVDNSLSLGAYTLEAWDDGQIVFKKNPYYALANSKYSIAGIHYNILTAVKTDNEAAFREFLAGKIDACGIPEKYLKEYATNPLTKTTMGDSCFKLNINTLDQATWEYMFGTQGVITQHPQDQYWQVKPIMSNEHFTRGLSYAINRQEFAVNKGRVASASYLSPDYLSDPEKGVSYNGTKAHKDALSSIVTENTDEYGYSLELARDYFRMALDELEASGAYTPGTKAQPTVISLTCMWYLAAFEEPYFKPLKQYWEDAFNDDSVSGGRYKLEVNFYAPATPTEAYNMMKAGRFDIGFGSITGNPLDVIDFLSILSSTPTVSSGWTLNWGLDTSKATSDILVYDGMRWSYDALQQAGVSAVVVENGELSDTTLIDTSITATPSQDNTTLTLTYKILYNVDLDVKATLDKFILFYGVDDDYDEWSIMNLVGENIVDDENGTITITVTLDATELAKIPNNYEYLGVDAYISYSAGNVSADGIFSEYFDKPVVEAAE